MSEELLPCPWCKPGESHFAYSGTCVRCTYHTGWIRIVNWNRRASLSTQPETEPAPTGPIPEDAATQITKYIWVDSENGYQPIQNALLLITAKWVRDGNACEQTILDLREALEQSFAEAIRMHPLYDRACDAIKYWKDTWTECASGLDRTKDELTQALKEREMLQVDCASLQAHSKYQSEEMDYLRAKLSAVTQERDNLAAARDRALSRIHENLDPDHNPDNLTPEQYGAADGWRLLKRSEAVGFECSEMDGWACKSEVWDACLDISKKSELWDRITYRTRLSVAELAALRAKGAEQ